MMHIDDNMCEVCGTCAAVCPADAISIGRDSVAIDSGVCVSCQACESVCPVGAISHEKDHKTA